MHDKLKFLGEGGQTRTTAEIKHLTSSIGGDSRDMIIKMLSKLASLKYSGFDQKLFRKRTADQILKDGFTTGCTDSAIAFVAMSRACGLPTKYVETISVDWLKNGNENSIEGHQYAQVWMKEEKRWIWVDPFGNRIDTPSPDEEGRKIYKIGLDSWDIGIKDFKNLKDLFLKFKENI
jgi:hypothetical protein